MTSSYEIFFLQQNTIQLIEIQKAAGKTVRDGEIFTKYRTPAFYCVRKELTDEYSFTPDGYTRNPGL
jgi:hypothetical protein